MNVRNETYPRYMWPTSQSFGPGPSIPVRLEWDQFRRAPRYVPVHHGCSLRKHEARQSGWLCIWWSAFITGRIQEHAWIVFIWFNPAFILPGICCARYWSHEGFGVFTLRERDDRSWGETRSQPSHVKARRCILPENEETDWRFTCTLMWLQSALKQWTASDQLTLLTMN